MIESGLMRGGLEEKEVLFEEGVLRLTSHNFIWVTGNYSRAHRLGHGQLAGIEEHTSGVIRRKSQIRFYTNAQRTFRLDFSQGGRDKVYQAWKVRGQRSSGIVSNPEAKCQIIGNFGA